MAVIIATIDDSKKGNESEDEMEAKEENRQ